MAAGFTGYYNPGGTGKRCQQRNVQARCRVIGIGHFGLQGAVMLGHQVAALADFLHGLLGFGFPGVIGTANRAVDVVAPAANFAMHRPDHQPVAIA